MTVRKLLGAHPIDEIAALKFIRSEIDLRDILDREIASVTIKKNQHGHIAVCLNLGERAGEMKSGLGMT